MGLCRNSCLTAQPLLIFRGDLREKSFVSGSGVARGGAVNFVEALRVGIL